MMQIYSFISLIAVAGLLLNMFHSFEEAEAIRRLRRRRMARALRAQEEAARAEIVYMADYKQPGRFYDVG